MKIQGGVSVGLLVAVLLGGGGLVCGGGSSDQQAKKAAQPADVTADVKTADDASAGTAARGSGMSEKEKAQKEPYPNDAGPMTIDVSSYSAEMQAKYKTLQQCANCHVLARPINTQFHDKDTWRRYVKRMIRKPGCGISNADGKKIYEFLVYDSQKRKISKKTQWKAHRLKLLKKFKQEHPDRYQLLFEDRSPEAEVAKELPGW